MPANRTKLIAAISLSILLCIFGCIGIAEISKKGSEDQASIRRLHITIDVNRREELFAQLRKFSEKHELEFYLNFYRGGEIFSVEMRGKRIVIAALSKPINATELDISFFEEDPTNPPSQETMDELYNDLKSFISEIPNAKITEEN